MNTSKEVFQVFKDTIRILTITWKESRFTFVATAVAVALASSTPFVQNFALGQMLNELVNVAGSGSLNKVSRDFLVLMLLAGSVFAFANTVQFFFKTVLYKRMFHSLTVLIHRKIALLDIATHENQKKKDLITKVQENAMWRAPDFVQRMAYLTQNLLEVLLATLVFLAADWRLGILIFVASLPRLWLDLRYNHEMWIVETSMAERRRKGWHARWPLIDLRALIEVKLFQNVDFFVSRMGEHFGAIKDKEITTERKNLRGQLLSLVFSEGVAILAICVFVMRVVRGELELGTLTFYLGSLASFRLSLNMLSQNVGSQFRDAKFVRDMFQAFDLQPTLRTVGTERTATLESIREIVFDDVWFKYPGTENWVLRGITLRVAGGSTLGIVAENGSGKSTLAKLLCRIYDPTKGRILVNGIDIREFDLEPWQMRIGVMLQEYGHYNHLSVEDAIRLGRTSQNGASVNGEIQHAAIAGDAHDFIMNLPKQYQTVLGREFEAGVELSGGEYQKLALARMFYRQSQIAIFDEPTSAIDGEAEARIFDRLLNGLPDCTKLLISHRYYTLKKAGLICLIKDGRVAESGTHEQLLTLGGIYAERYRAQADEYL